ncbi:c-type cytochrome [Yoonia sediminilitoris]|uniref:Cytochrome c n=1 Tax=Yoonia sediminilitoris TaxID=1286148 RepID=A0A2T6KD26_9RHOB|nr:cytochrome c family protein [Yoonia sediminilitoris]PUB12847.1 cytochrome c [Yoonia sediminilitoris]RCW94326.1 cytochrome c [Yoonia sediminilitoris]
MGFSVKMRLRFVLGFLMATGAVLTGATAYAENQSAELTFELTGDAAAGERVFRKCQACHDVGAGAMPKSGPVLNGILGRPAANAEDFAYSAAMTSAASTQDLIWTPQTLDAFLTKPKAFIDGTKMTFIGLRKDEDRANVIAYLATFLEEEN